MILKSLLFLALFFYCGFHTGYGHLDLPEGSKCMDGEYNGTCVNMYNCETFVIDLNSKNSETKLPETCSYNGSTPIICCTSCKRVSNISDYVFTPSGALFKKNGRKAYDNCLEYSKYAEKRCIVEGGVEKLWDNDAKCHAIRLWIYTASGGYDATRDFFTHMALLGYGDFPQEAQWLCGGSLISEKYILTAAHCSSSPALGPVTYAALGILKRSDPEELWQRYKIQRIITHPEYKSPSKYHDIALLETEVPVKFNTAVFPACLPDEDGNQDTEEGGLTAVTAVGWGALGPNRALADTLQVIDIEVFSESSCSAQYPPHRLLKYGYNHTTQMCSGDLFKAVDTCHGDSGGPLQYYSSSLCLYKILGVTSYGRSCGYPGQAGMYTRVRHYIPWIESIVWP